VTPVPDLRNRARGRWGEDEAARWYRAAGYEVVARNWRCDLGEIDLIVHRGGVLVFAEVKARADDRFGPAAAAVGYVKQRTIRRVAARWLASGASPPGGGSRELRFDVVAVTGSRVDVIEGAF
jgi:putative endonuclease